MSKEPNHTFEQSSAGFAAGSGRAFRTGKTVFVLAWLATFWETFWPRLVPLFIVACIFVASSWFGLWLAVPDWARWVGLAGFIAMAALALWRLRETNLPDTAGVHRRIENASGFTHRPVSAQTDQLATEQDDFAHALWHEHQKRMAAQLDNLAAGTPRPDGNRFDRFAFRAILPIIAFVALGFSYGTNGGRIGDIIAPPVDTKKILSRLDMWISPPSYTGKPPLYFAAPSDSSGTSQPATSVSALTGSQLSINYVGEEDLQARYREGETMTRIASAPDAPTDANAKSYLSSLTSSGSIEVFVGDTVIATWQVEVEADQKPVIRLENVPSTALSGALELDYSVEDDYGVVSAKGIIAALESPSRDTRPLVEAPVIDLPLARARAKSGRSKVNRDLSSHPFAGSKVQLTLEATDDPGQIGRSEPMTIVLPGRRFTDPMAKALVEQRRILALDANKAMYVANLLDAVTTHPDVFKIDPKIFISLQTAYRMIAPARDASHDDKLREAMDILWEVALALELGDLSEVERKLREAQEKLAEALENGAGDEEIDKLMEELRQAMADFLEQMAKEMARNPIQENPLANQNLQTLTQRDLEKMMQRIEDLAKSGSKDAARELLAEMQRMMDNLRAGQHQQQRQAEGNELNQALDKLSELMQKQQQLMDKTFSMQRREPRQGENSQEGQQPDPNGENQQGENGEQGEQPMTPEEFADAMKQLKEQQEALQKQLGELGQQLEDLGLDPSNEFGEAGEEMGEAGENLGKGQSGDAAANQGRALEALRQGAQSMMQQMAGDRNQGGQQQGQAGDPNQREQGTDPLGRRNEAQGRFDDDATKIPGEIDAQRAREIMEAIRRKLSDPLRPLLERDYLERLLNSRQ